MKLGTFIHARMCQIFILCLMTQTLVYSQTPLPHLHVAAENGDYSETERLLSVGADPNEVDFLGRPALERAVWANHEDIVALLLAAGSSVEKSFGRNALQDAFFTESEPIAKKLIRAGAPINEPDEKGNTLLHWAVDLGIPEILTLLLAFKPDLNVKNNAGLTALHLAVETGRLNIAKKLIKSGAFINVKDAEGETPRDYAVAEKNKELVKLFDRYLRKSKEEL